MKIAAIRHVSNLSHIAATITGRSLFVLQGNSGITFTPHREYLLSLQWVWHKSQRGWNMVPPLSRGMSS